MRSFKVSWTFEGQEVTSACSYSETAAYARVRLLEEAGASDIEVFEVDPWTKERI